jgi:MFS family permease
LRDDRDWRRFVTSRLISLTGTSVTFVAFPVLVYSLSGSPLVASLVAALEAVPYLMFGLPAGVLADRLNRKRVMVAVEAVNAVVLASIPIASWFDALTVPHLLVAAFVVPALFVFFDAADFGALPTLVGGTASPRPTARCGRRARSSRQWCRSRQQRCSGSSRRPR